MAKRQKYSVDQSILIKDLLNQKEEAISYMYDEYYPQVEKYILTNSGSKDDAHDIFQDAIIILYESLQEENMLRELNLKAYFFGIARNIFNAQARKKSEFKKSLLTKEIDIVDEIDDSEFDEELQEIVSQCFHALTNKDKMVLTMFSEGLSFEEIAHKMRFKSENEARRQKNLAKESLLELLMANPEYRKLKKLI